MKKKIILCAGGTGGHVFPSSSLTFFLSKRNYETIFLTDQRGLKLLNKDLSFYKVFNMKPYRQGKLNKIFFYLNLIIIFINSFLFLRKEKPNVVFGFGGYFTFPICLAAKLLNIKILLYEPNVVIGRVNNFFARFCEIIFTNYENIEKISDKYTDKCIKVGSIMREEIFNYKTKKKDYSNQSKTIIVLGGSQGAEIFGKIIPKVIVDMTKQFRINIIQQAISTQVNEIKNIYKIWKRVWLYK